MPRSLKLRGRLCTGGCTELGALLDAASAGRVPPAATQLVAVGASEGCQEVTEGLDAGGASGVTAGAAGVHELRAVGWDGDGELVVLGGCLGARELGGGAELRVGSGGQESPVAAPSSWGALVAPGAAELTRASAGPEELGTHIHVGTGGASEGGGRAGWVGSGEGSICSSEGTAGPPNPPEGTSTCGWLTPRDVALGDAEAVPRDQSPTGATAGTESNRALDVPSDGRAGDSPTGGCR